MPQYDNDKADICERNAKITLSVIKAGYDLRRGSDITEKDVG